jgi:hypothetical protein
VLRPLGWLLSICGFSLLGAIEMKAATWVLVFLACATGASVLLYMGAFVFCLLTDKEALRSETYSIQRMAIEKGFRGDSTTGIVPEEASPARLLPQAGRNAQGEEEV